MEEAGILFGGVDINAVLFLVLNVEEAELVNELPVSTQVTIGRSPQLLSFCVGEMAF